MVQGAALNGGRANFGTGGRANFGTGVIRASADGSRKRIAFQVQEHKRFIQDTFA